jgi:hypothetical protein
VIVQYSPWKQTEGPVVQQNTDVDNNILNLKSSHGILVLEKMKYILLSYNKDKIDSKVKIPPFSFKWRNTKCREI